MQYPALFKLDPSGSVVVTFRDIPEAITQGDTEAEAMNMAIDALVTAMDFYFEDKRPVPAPSKAKRGERLVDLPPSIEVKVLLLNAMLDQKVTASELARRLEMTRQEVTRLIDLHHTTKIDQVGKAIEAVGKRLELKVA